MAVCIKSQTRGSGAPGESYVDLSIHYMSYSLNSLKGGFFTDYELTYYRAYQEGY